MTLCFPLIVVAQSATESFEAIEVSLPTSAGGLLALIVGLAVVFALAVRTSLKDSRFLKWGWRAALLIPRLAALVLIVVIIVNPSRRTQTSRTEQSRVGVLVDTSLSMAYREAASAVKSSEEIEASEAASTSELQMR